MLRVHANGTWRSEVLSKEVKTGAELSLLAMRILLLRPHSRPLHLQRIPSRRMTRASRHACPVCQRPPTTNIIASTLFQPPPRADTVMGGSRVRALYNIISMNKQLFSFLGAASTQGNFLGKREATPLHKLIGFRTVERSATVKPNCLAKKGALDGVHISFSGNPHVLVLPTFPP